MQSRSSLVSIVLAIGLLGVSACGPAATAIPQATPTPGNGAIEMGTIESQALAGNLLGDRTKRSFFVYLPPDYSQGAKRYPVVYILHGINSPPDIYVSRLKAVEDQLSVLRPDNGLILVFPDCTNKLGGCTYLSSPTIGDYETYIVNELVAQVDQTYRTLADRESRGIAGCSMGGDGAAHLAFKYPQIFGAVAALAGSYDWTNDPNWERGRVGFKTQPLSFDDLKQQGVAPAKIDLFHTKYFMMEAAAAAPNPGKPPFYMDMPFEIVGGEPRIVTEVADKINALDPVHDVNRYLEQPVRLRGVMLYQSSEDPDKPVESSRSFDKTLTKLGVEHTYLEVATQGHCLLDWTPVVQFMLEHLRR